MNRLDGKYVLIYM